MHPAGLRAVSVAALALVLSLTGCADSSVQPDDPDAESTSQGPAPPEGLDASALRAWEQWQQADLDDYTYRLSVECFCPTVHGDVRVSDDRVVAIAGQPYRGQTVIGFDEAPTIEGLFGELAHALSKADDVTVAYDADIGVPTVIRVDWIEHAIDDEIRYAASVPKP